jgi:hypothetical protein
MNGAYEAGIAGKLSFHCEMYQLSERIKSGIE